MGKTIRFLFKKLQSFITCISSSALLLLFPVITWAQTVPLIQDISISGNQRLSSSQIFEITGIRPGDTYDVALLDKGLQILLEAYADQGHLWAEIMPPAPRWTTDSSAVSISINIDEGPLALIERIEITGNRLWDTETLLTSFDSRSGTVFSASIFERDMDRLLTRYEENAYPYCAIELTRIRGQEGELFIDLTINEGPFIRVDGFRVEGNTQTKSHVITRELRLSPGDPFDQRHLKQGHERLLRLRLFDSVSEPSLELNSAGDGGVIVIRVAEGRSSAIDGLLGYTPGINGQSGFVTGAFSLALQNIAGTGRRALVSWLRRDPLTSDIRVQYEEPWIFNTPITVGMDLGQVNQDSSYTATDIGSQIKMPLSERFEGHLRIGWRRVIPDTLSVGLLPRSREVSAQLGLSTDTRDQPGNPRSGLFALFDVTYGLRWNETTAFFTPERSRVQTSQVNVGLEQYVPIGRQHVAAVAVRGVDIRSGEQVLPLSQQFRFGGTKTLRGYRENEFRGSRVAWSNLEYRILLSSRSRFFLFFDTGFFEFQRPITGGTERIHDIKIGYGLGIRLESALGILGIDYGIGEDDTLLNGKVHFGLRNEF